MIEGGRLTMSVLAHSLRARSLDASWATAMVLGVAGLAVAGLETISFGHQHLAGEHAVHHHHFHLGSHEHGEEQPGHDGETPRPDERGAPWRAATVSATPTLFQPAEANVPSLLTADSTPVVFALALPLIVRPPIRRARPRAPPTSNATPHFLT